MKTKYLILLLALPLFITACGVSKTRGWYFGPWQTKPPVEETPKDYWDVPPRDK